MATGPRPLDAATSARMSRQASRNTGPELAVRSELHRLGRRFRLHLPVPGIRRRTIDVALVGPRVAVFVDGCFWHGCPEHGSRPANNGSWWASKLAANAARDRDTDDRLREAGWRVVRAWEHEDPAAVAVRVDRVAREGR